MHSPVGLIIFITFATTIAAVNAQYVPNSSQDQLVELRQTGTANLSCIVDSDCGSHSYCRNNTCQCYEGYITWKTSDNCAYNQIAKLTAFLLSFFVGTLGVDWFVLSRGNGGYIAAGVFKLLMSCGCCVGLPCVLIGARKHSSTWIFVGRVINALLVVGSSVWWLVDWIRILANGFPDGNGAPLKRW